MLTFTHLIFILGLILFCLLAFYAYKHLSHGWSLKLLFKDFNRKMWMTVSLGFLFFGLYLFTVCMAVYFVRLWGADLFLLVYRHPVDFVYGGLWLFAFLSLSIYLARMFIKYLYLTHGKDS